MKTLILYASTYGYAKECAEKVKDLIQGDVTVLNIKTDKVPSLEGFDNVVLGGSIYMGQIDKKLNTYCALHLNQLLQKKVALFLCCGLPEKFEETIKNCFPKDLLEHAVARECFGGELRTEKMNLAHKMIAGLMQRAAKPGTPQTMSLPENMVKLAEAINRPE